MNAKNNISVCNLLSAEEITALLGGHKKAETNNILSFFTSAEYKQKSDILAQKINKKMLEIYRIDTNIIPTIPAVEDSDFFIIFTIENDEQSGKVLLSDAFCSNIINLVLGGKTKENKLLKTPSTVKILENITKTLCETLLSQNTKITLSEQPQNTPSMCAENCFSFSLPEGGTFCLIFPEIQKNENVQQTDNKSLSENIPIKISAVVKQSEITLKNLSAWQIGDFLPIGIEKNAEISILCENKPLFKAVMGQKNNHIAVKITKKEK